MYVVGRMWEVSHQAFDYAMMDKPVGPSSNESFESTSNSLDTNGE